MATDGAVEIKLGDSFRQGRREFIRFHTARGDEYAVPCGMETLKSFVRFRQRVSDHLGVSIHHASQDAPTPWLRSHGWLDVVRAASWRTLTREAKARQHQARDEFVATLCQALAGGA